MKKFGVFGGTINPFHMAELILGRTTVSQFSLDKVIYIPNGIPPHKTEDVLDKELRYEMLVAGLEGEDKLEASRLEIDRPGVTWTIDTLKELKKLHGDDVLLHFIMGADNVAKFAEYDRKDEFFALCKLLIAPRKVAAKPGLSEQDIADMAAPQAEKVRKLLPGADLDIINIAPNSLSSTEIRIKIRSGESITGLVPPAVEKIIMAKGHYKEIIPAAASPQPKAA